MSQRTRTCISILIGVVVGFTVATFAPMRTSQAQAGHVQSARWHCFDLRSEQNIGTTDTLPGAVQVATALNSVAAAASVGATLYIVGTDYSRTPYVCVVRN